MAVNEMLQRLRNSDIVERGRELFSDGSVKNSFADLTPSPCLIDDEEYKILHRTDAVETKQVVVKKSNLKWVWDEKWNKKT